MSLALPAVSAPASRAPIRRLPTPVSEPPFDDELPDAGDRQDERSFRELRAVRGDLRTTGVQQMLALPLPLPNPPPTEPLVNEPLPTEPLIAAVPTPAGASTLTNGQRGASAQLRLVPAYGERDAEPAPLPPPHAWAARLAQALAEVLSGTRPAQQLVRWTSLDVYACLRRHVTHRLQNSAPGRGAPRVALRSVRLSEPLEGIAEVCAVLQIGPRARALALRIEAVNGRWRCTAFEMG